MTRYKLAVVKGGISAYAVVAVESVDEGFIWNKEPAHLRNCFGADVETGLNDDLRR